MLYETELEGVNPKEVNVFSGKNFDVIKTKFNIMDWVSNHVIDYFGYDLVKQVIKDLEISFTDLIGYKQISITNGKYNSKLPKYYNIIRSEDTSYTQNDKKYIRTEYTLEVPDTRNLGDINTECLLRTFPKLKDFQIVKDVDYTKHIFFGLKAIRTSSIRLNDLPKELKNLTVNELLSLDKVILKEVENIFKVYSDLSCFVKCGDTSIHLNLGKSLNDIDLDTSLEATKKYTIGYNTGNTKQLINLDIDKVSKSKEYKKIKEAFILTK